MEWTEDGIVLAARRHGESGLVLSLLTRERGRHAGLVRGGAGRRARALYEPGNRLRATWKARLADHLGGFTCELAAANTAALLDDAARLAALTSACAVVEVALPEREPHPGAFDQLVELIALLPGPDFAADYVRWELALLGELGFGLDLSSCAATGSSDDLAYVSPKSGRAVSRAAGAPYRGRLLALPGFLLADRPAGPGDIGAGLRLTGHFLAQHVFSHRDRGAPAARSRLVERLSRPETAAR